MNQCSLTKQYLVEAQIKLNAVQYRLDYEYAECLDISRPLVVEFYRLLEYVQRLENELKEVKS